MIGRSLGRTGVWAACGGALAGLMVAVAIWAWQDTSENAWLLDKAVPLTLFLVAAVVYCLAAWLCPKATLRRGQWAGVMCACVEGTTQAGRRIKGLDLDCKKGRR